MDKETEDYYKKLMRKIDVLLSCKKIIGSPGLNREIIAEYIGVNRTYIYKAVRMNRDMTVSSYILLKRVQYAQRLMKRNPTQRLYVVARNSGFRDASRFSKCFKIYAGMTPMEYAESIK